MKAIEQQFLKLVQEQLARVERIKANNEVTDYSTKKQIIIGYCAGDGIGPIIMNVTINILNKLLANEIQSGKIVLKEIEGLTIENRLANNISIPENVLAEIKSCDVLLKGPTTTPSGLFLSHTLLSLSLSLTHTHTLSHTHTHTHSHTHTHTLSPCGQSLLSDEVLVKRLCLLVKLDNETEELIQI